MPLRIFLLLSVITTSCDEPKFPKPRPTTLETDVLYCDVAAANLGRLGCPEAKATKRGMTFEELCRDLESKGIYVGAQCLSKVKSCDDVDDCTGSR